LLIFFSTCENKTLALSCLYNVSKLKYNTKSYVRYNFETNNRTKKIENINLLLFKQYKNYMLIINKKIINVQIFLNAKILDFIVCLNNKLVFLIDRFNITIKQFHKIYLIEFDKNKDLRFYCILLRSLTKIFFNINIVNLDNCILKCN